MKLRRIGRVLEWAIELVIRSCGVASVVFVILILAFLLRNALPAFNSVSLGEALGGRLWRPTSNPPQFGFLPLILGSALVTVGSLLISVPIGIGAAVFLAEVAPRRVREIAKPIVELLGAVPSVVFGFVGLMLVGAWIQRASRAAGDALPGPDWLKTALNMPSSMAAITGAVLLALMTLPTIVSIAEDALDSVPERFRQGSLALGATRWQTIRGVTIPAARSGIMASVMLGVGRAVGETMTVLMVTGNAAVVPSLTTGLFRPVRTMTATIAAEMGETAHQTPHFHVLFLLGLLLFLITFCVNTTADIITHRGRHEH
ncbi:MAG TPA: phosphate ABC transporter permease subunit PstC [Armatimonadota bacterium]|nr:phosphate ABC transporter permease subunit PstC [Armatimonadota bacterium]HQK93346.1 phosphate ABC transporter permease subunit PstC [Armatimonadota bacterium]